ncbi:ribonuclease kappa-like [Gigantopelta aegis]|uniref:ribonuclease kappa-like n=1 Tax=Gigantopelta aegis TaxID=1735272 RepID=UPI001B88DF12|nr:ribonuclease kappa-like [Gigantopelta aegis]
MFSYFLHLIMIACPICGPKLSVYCTILSIWAIIMLGLLGIFFYLQSPNLFEDLPHKDWAAANFSREYIVQKYEQNAINCWIAAGLYVVLGIFCFTQQRMNSRANYEMS